ncbi:MAG TPA: hypothetical protein VD908_12170 [Cytophagales bacterium]|nr:hypothetical protein [Cytophagales bacterium]
MFVEFDTLPPTARVWVYQSDKKFNEAEARYISEKAEEFINYWQSHGNDLRGSAKIFYDHFLILSIDESHSSSSGCSIDKSVHFIQALEKELNINLLNRSKQSYLSDNTIQFFPIQAAKQVVTNGLVTKETGTFNNNIMNKKELEEKWIVPAAESWLGKFFKN